MSTQKVESIIGAVLKAFENEKEEQKHPGKGGDRVPSSRDPRRWGGLSVEWREAERKIKGLENQVYQLKGAGRQREDRIRVNPSTLEVQ